MSQMEPLRLLARVVVVLENGRIQLPTAPRFAPLLPPVLCASLPSRCGRVSRSRRCATGKGNKPRQPVANGFSVAGKVWGPNAFTSAPLHSASSSLALVRHPDIGVAVREPVRLVVVGHGLSAQLDNCLDSRSGARPTCGPVAQISPSLSKEADVIMRHGRPIDQLLHKRCTNAGGTGYRVTSAANLVLPRAQPRRDPSLLPQCLERQAQ